MSLISCDCFFFHFHWSNSCDTTSGYCSIVLRGSRIRFIRKVMTKFGSLCQLWSGYKKHKMTNCCTYTSGEGYGCLQKETGMCDSGSKEWRICTEGASFFLHARMTISKMTMCLAIYPTAWQGRGVYFTALQQEIIFMIERSLHIWCELCLLVPADVSKMSDEEKRQTPILKLGCAYCDSWIPPETSRTALCSK